MMKKKHKKVYGRKAAALAIAVSLWTAGGNVASADAVNEVTWDGTEANPDTAITKVYDPGTTYCITNGVGL